MPFKKKPSEQVGHVRSVRVSQLTEDKIKEHCKTLANGLREYAEQLTKLDNELKKLSK
jgi:hypothetical protein